MNGDKIAAGIERAWWVVLVFYYGTTFPDWTPWALLAWLVIGIVWAVLSFYRWAERRERRKVA